MVVKALRKEYGLTQEDLAMKSGVGLCFVRNLEQGKPTLRMDKVNQLLDLFNYELTATKKQWDRQKYIERKSLQASWWKLTPAYDLLNIAIANPKDKEELALPLSGRKTKVRLDDFLNAAKTMGLDENVVLHLIEGLQKALPKWQTLIHNSFLSEDMKKAYEELIVSRLDRLQKWDTKGFLFC